MKKIRFMDTSLRDGFQSVFGARALTDDFIPAVESAVHAGIHGKTNQRPAGAIKKAQ